jgi:hypothetical protein
MKVTVSGESAGALSASYHYLNEDFATLARAAVRAFLMDADLHPAAKYLIDIPIWDSIYTSHLQCLSWNALLASLSKQDTMRHSLAR